MNSNLEFNLEIDLKKKQDLVYILHCLYLLALALCMVPLEKLILGTSKSLKCDSEHIIKLK